LTVNPAITYGGTAGDKVEVMEVAAFARLEAKIEDLLGRLTQMKSENAELKSRLEEKEKEVAELGELMATQDAERDEVRKRIENLVQKLENY